MRVRSKRLGHVFIEFLPIDRLVVEPGSRAIAEGKASLMCGAANRGFESHPARHAGGGFRAVREVRGFALFVPPS